MTDIEKLDELKKIIQEKIKERNELKQKIDKEELMKLQSEYYMVLSDSDYAEYFMFDKYNEKSHGIGCWRFTVDKDGNEENSYIIEKNYFYSINDIPHSMQWITKEDFEEHLRQYFFEIKNILLKVGR